MKRKRGHEGAGAPTHATSAGQNTSSSSSSGCIVSAGGDVISVQRGEDPPADCGDNDPVDEIKRETEQQEVVSMDCMSFQEYCDAGGLWMVRRWCAQGFNNHCTILRFSELPEIP